VDAYARGYEVLVAADAVGSTEPMHDEVSRAWLSGRAARFLRTSEILAGLDGSGPCRRPSGIAEAVAAARTARAAWARRRPQERSAILDSLATALEAREEAIGLLIAEEVGKPVTDARAEIGLAVDLIREIAHHAGRTRGRELASGDVRVRRGSVGLIAAVTPFNNPVLLPVGKIAPAVGYGNAVVWKPAPEAPRSSAALLDTLTRAGLDPALVAMVPGDAETVREIVCGHGVDAVTFTGSTAAGRRVAALCARAGIPIQAELGGNNGALVMADADLPGIVPRLARLAFGNAGQRCTALRRFLVEESIQDDFLETFAAAAAALRVGDPLDPATEVGPLIGHAHRDRVAAAVGEAVAGGARILAGGRIPEIAGDRAYYEPTVLRCEDPTAPIVREETFGPVAVVMGVPDFAEGMRLLNDTEYGLVAALFSDDREHRERFEASAEAGILRVNDPWGTIHPAAPFGGVKASGLGPPEHGDWDLDFYTRAQVTYEPRLLT